MIQLVNTKEAAKILGCSPLHVRRLLIHRLSPETIPILLLDTWWSRNVAKHFAACLSFV